MLQTSYIWRDLRMENILISDRSYLTLLFIRVVAIPVTWLLEYSTFQIPSRIPKWLRRENSILRGNKNWFWKTKHMALDGIYSISSIIPNPDLGCNFEGKKVSKFIKYRQKEDPDPPSSWWNMKHENLQNCVRVVREIKWGRLSGFTCNREHSSATTLCTNYLHHSNSHNHTTSKKMFAAITSFLLLSTVAAFAPTG